MSVTSTSLVLKRRSRWATGIILGIVDDSDLRTAIGRLEYRRILRADRRRRATARIGRLARQARAGVPGHRRSDGATRRVAPDRGRSTGEASPVPALTLSWRH